MAMGKVRLNGRFPAGTVVTLVRAADAGVMRAEGGEELDTQTVGEDGSVEFSMEVGARGFITGYVDGFPVEVRVTGREAGDETITLGQAPIGPDRVRLSDGSWADEAPKQVAKKDLPLEAAPFLSQQQVPEGTPQRSDTPRGTAHPFDPEEPAPYESQENVDEDVLQMSDTETGSAARVAVGPQRQEDVPGGVWQRSATPTGVATPIPGGGAIEAQAMRESSLAKEMRGEPVRAAAEPLRTAGGGGGGGDVSNEPAGMSQPGEDNRTGTDAMGQPAYEDVARAAAVGRAKKPTGAMRGEPKDAKVEKTPQTSGKAAKEEAVPEPHPTRRSKPPEGGMAADQAPEDARPDPVKAPGRPKKR